MEPNLSANNSVCSMGVQTLWWQSDTNFLGDGSRAKSGKL